MEARHRRRAAIANGWAASDRSGHRRQCAEPHVGAGASGVSPDCVTRSTGGAQRARSADPCNTLARNAKRTRRNRPSNRTPSSGPTPASANHAGLGPLGIRRCRRRLSEGAGVILADRRRHLARPRRRERRNVRSRAGRGAVRARRRRDVGPGRYRDVRATRRGRVLRAWSGRLRCFRRRRRLLPDRDVPSAGDAHGMARFLLPRLDPRVAARGARRRDHRRGARGRVRRRRPDAGVHPGRRTDHATRCAGTRTPFGAAFGWRNVGPEAVSRNLSRRRWTGRLLPRRRGGLRQHRAASENTARQE